MTKISVCMVVYNEAKVIARCLDSLKDVVDEIVIVMDGKSTDNTYEIIKKYTDKIYFEKHLGEAEPHKTYSWSKARNDWIFEIDGDEYILPQLKEFLRCFEENKDVSGYRFIWQQWYKDKPLMGTHGKTALFKRCDVIGNDRSLRTPLRLTGKVKKLPHIINHKPTKEVYNFSLSFVRLTKYRGMLRAKHLLEVKKVNRWLCLPKSIVVYLIEVIATLRRGAWKYGYRGIIFSLTTALTFFFTQIYLFKLSGKNV